MVHAKFTTLCLGTNAQVLQQMFQHALDTIRSDLFLSKRIVKVVYKIDPRSTSKFKVDILL